MRYLALPSVSMKEPKPNNDYARNDVELFEYYTRYGELPDFDSDLWFEEPDEGILKHREQVKAAHLKTHLPLNLMIHWSDLDVSREIASQLGISIGRKETHTSLNVFCANLYQLVCLGQTNVMSMSFNNNTYDKTAPYNPLGITRNIIDIANKFVAAGYLRKHIGFHNRKGGRSRKTALVLSDTLVSRLLDLDLPNVILPEIEPIHRVRVENDGVKTRLPISTAELPEKVRDHRDLLLRYNRFIRQFKVTLSRAELREHHDAIAFHVTYYGDDYEMHSRVFGGQYQTIKKELRQQFLMIDGEPTVEVDISESYPTILYAIAGKPLSSDRLGKSYWFRGVEPTEIERKTFKAAFNRAFSIGDRSKVVNSLVRADRTGEGVDVADAVDAEKILSEMEVYHPALREYFYKPEYGMRCMEKEGAMILETMRWGLRHCVLILPFHDALICKKRDSEKVSLALREAARKVIFTEIAITLTS